MGDAALHYQINEVIPGEARFYWYGGKTYFVRTNLPKNFYKSKIKVKHEKFWSEKDGIGLSKSEKEKLREEIVKKTEEKRLNKYIQEAEKISSVRRKARDELMNTNHFNKTEYSSRNLTPNPPSSRSNHTKTPRVTNSSTSG